MKFNPKRLKAIELLAIGTIANQDIASELRINPQTLCKWKKDPEFMHAVVLRSRQLLKEDLPAIYKKLGEQGKIGSHQHIKILIDHLEKLEEAKSSQTSLSFTWITNEDS